MRRTILGGLVGVTALAALALPASASFESHFSVISKQTSQRESGGSFTYTDKLVATFDHDLRVGRDRATCHTGQGGKLRCRAVIHLNGKVGGYGEMKVNGNLSGTDSRVNIVGGSGDFNGVAGKVLIGPDRHGTNRNTYSLVR